MVDSKTVALRGLTPPSRPKWHGRVVQDTRRVVVLGTELALHERVWLLRYFRSTGCGTFYAVDARGNLRSMVLWGIFRTAKRGKALVIGHDKNHIVYSLPQELWSKVTWVITVNKCGNEYALLGHDPGGVSSVVRL